LHPDLRDYNVLPWEHCANFALDNGLQGVDKVTP